MAKRMLLTTCLILLLYPEAHANNDNMLTGLQRARILHEAWSRQDMAQVKIVERKDKQGVAPAIQSATHWPKEFYQKVSVKARNLPFSQVIKPLAQSIHFHLILGPGVEDKKVDADLSELAIGKILDDVLFPLGYGFKAEDGHVIILAQETRVYRVILPPVSQDFSDVTSNESFIQAQEGVNTQGAVSTNQQVKVGTKILVQNSSMGISFWGDVSDNLKMLVSNTGQFSINKPAGAVIVSDAPNNLAKVDAYFDDLNKKVSQQIEVDMRVVEVSLNDENRLGIDWNALAEDLKGLNSLAMGTNFASQNFTNGSLFKFMADAPNPGSGRTDNGVRFVMDALSKQGHIEVVSQPRVVMLNNQVAVIQVGSTQSFLDRSTIETTPTGTVTSISTSQVQEGVTMRLLGNIVGDQIYLSVSPVVTTIDNIRSITSGNTTVEAPQTTTKSINTLVKLTEGETVAIGGLITSTKQKNNQGVPGLSKLPFLGKLFAYTQDKKTKSELVIFITPKKV